MPNGCCIQHKEREKGGEIGDKEFDVLDEGREGTSDVESVSVDG